MIFEIIGVVAFSLSGALTAMKKEMDIFGACVLGMTTAIGGGILRDLILGVTPPAAFVHPLQAVLGLAIPALTYLPIIQKFFARDEHRVQALSLMIADAVGLGVFTVVGVNACFQSLPNPNFFTAIFLGVITGVGGGVLRDVLSMNLPKIFVKHFYACASIAGAIVAFFVRIWFGSLIASIAGAAVVIALRFLASFLRWNLPKPKYPIEQEK
ncbi:MAG: TRIC cation channel family protein [Clostridia bacterium]|nr:TRIC cation channel family protein [Clostridia bacterium]